MKRLLVFTLLALSWVSAAWSQTEPRLALVIGNAQYVGKNTNLANPVNDARLMASVLTGLGFRVTKIENAKTADIQRAVSRFAQQLKANPSVGFFYFAGHGAGIQGEHYLIGVDAVVQNTAHVQKSSITLRSVNEQMRHANSKLNLLVVDAAADNPFQTSQNEAENSKVLLQATPNTVIAISARPPSIAQDGKGNNGLYTENLAKAIAIEGLNLADVFWQTESAVREQSQSIQLPWSSFGVAGGLVYLKEKSDDPKVFGRSARGG